MDYRREIDGLRAIAVIPVILYHAGFQTFSGGFVGVDIFFVISGYLITSIILSELEQGTFSLTRFYERRARRILPALYLVLLFTLPLSWLWLTPTDMKNYSQSLVAVPLFSSNILFWHQASYWSVHNELKPLLHTWSLAVEEQYYVLFPLLLMLMWEFRKRWILSSLIAIAIVSLIASQYGTTNSPTATFYLLPTRAWELAIGAIIALYLIHQKRTIQNLLPHRIFHEAMSLVGLLMIGYAVFMFDETVPFPGLNALAPTIGTGLIILFSSSQTITGRFLSTKYLVGIGLISYSAYLWHQPLLAFARHRSITQPTELHYAVLSALSIVLAFLSWHYIEKPFRTKGIVSRKTIFLFAATGAAVFVLIGLTGQIANGFANRSISGGLTFQSIEEKRKSNHGLNDICNGLSTFSTDCRTSDKPEIIIWGDSYAMHLVQGIIASKNDAKIIQLTKSVCGPFFNIAPVIKPKHTTHWAQSCLKFTEKVHTWLKTNNTVKYAVLSSNFESYLSRENSLLTRNGGQQPTNFNFVLNELRSTLAELQSMGITPIIFSPLPSNGTDIGRCLSHAFSQGINLDECNFQVSAMTEDRLDAYLLLDAIKNDFTVVRLDEYTCDTILCVTHFGPNFLYRDVGHFTYEGSSMFGEKLAFYQLITNQNSK